LTPTTVIGIDPGSRATGWGVVRLEGREIVLLGCGVIRLGADMDLAERMMTLAERLGAVIEEHRPEQAAAEDVFVSRDPRAALKLGQARGAALAAVASARIPVSSYAPAKVKRAVTGSGRADKAQVQRMVQAMLGMEKPPARDAADALAVAICHARSLR
jgi:crossover junction endodeoxyribonuclease RuvC